MITLNTLGQRTVGAGRTIIEILSKHVRHILNTKVYIPHIPENVSVVAISRKNGCKRINEVLYSYDNTVEQGSWNSW